MFKKNPWVKVGYGLAIGMKLGKLSMCAFECVATAVLKRLNAKATKLVEDCDQAQQKLEELKEETD